MPTLLALHLENNAINKLEQGILTGSESLRALYLTGNAIEHMSPRSLDLACDLDTLHLGGNKLKEVPTEALSRAGNIKDLRLSGNSIRWVGPNAFKPLERSLKELYLNNMGLEKVSRNTEEVLNLILSYQTMFCVISHNADVRELSGRSGSRLEESLPGGQPAGGGA